MFSKNAAVGHSSPLENVDKVSVGTLVLSAMMTVITLQQSSYNTHCMLVLSAVKASRHETHF